MNSLRFQFHFESCSKLDLELSEKLLCFLSFVLLELWVTLLRTFTMPIVYALVARQKNVLAEYTSSSGNFPTVTRVLLAKIPHNDSRMSYVYDKHVFHYVVDNGITFLCMADEDVKRRVTFAFLEDIKRLWRAKFANIEATAIAFSLQESFAPVLKQQIEHYTASPGSTDTIGKVQQQIEGVKDKMFQNIDQLIDNSEKIELLVEKSENLRSEAKKFEKQSTQLKSHMWWRKMRNYFIMAFIVLIVILFISMMICGLDFKKCSKK